MSYIICFWDKSRIQVSDEVGDKLKEAILTESSKGFELGSNLYMNSGVEKIITKQEAFAVYPAEWEHLKEMEDIRPPNHNRRLGDGKKDLTAV